MHDDDILITHSSGTVDGIGGTDANGWNDVSGADAGPSPGAYTLATDYPFGNTILYGGGTSANGIDGGVLKINTGASRGTRP